MDQLEGGAFGFELVVVLDVTVFGDLIVLRLVDQSVLAHRYRRLGDGLEYVLDATGVVPVPVSDQDLLQRTVTSLELFSEQLDVLGHVRRARLIDQNASLN